MRQILVGFSVLFIGSHAVAQTAAPTVAPESVILARQAVMDLQAATTGALKRTLDAKGDVKPLKDGADAIAKSAQVIPALFPAGTDKGGNTKALPAVWSDRAGFEQAAANLGKAAQALSAAAASGDEAATANAFRDLGQACGNCHRNFRAR